jgi:hypothetical protein
MIFWIVIKRVRTLKKIAITKNLFHLKK